MGRVKGSRGVRVVGRVLGTGMQTYKELQELEYPLVRQDVEGVSADRVDDRKSMDFVLYQRIDGFKYTEER